MKHQLSFATVNVLSDGIAEIIITEGIEVSMEMLDEFDAFLSQHLSDHFALLINKVHSYNYTFEAKMTMASHENLIAIAVIVYKEADKKIINDVMALRAIDDWNLKTFSALELGWQQGYDWLQTELDLLVI
ncbi:hypothetical protein CMT41_16285 [Colwellia sp. MT41]|uniref:STAS/SEC14 domain-containing protein n=1 Tax=Colwellia marinimaniae TaxID=1513592 RepID=A0ABQ0MXC4_9GAMM|nr:MULTISPECIES: hypothetical protein [Colwellia]ALO36114.1 hypothetical protein CMT41_16285 [Colwellia sp. MT41]GAW97032.1 hypothetical protein MTCD1_02658 [Colwellia marinimaniae]